MTGWHVGKIVIMIISYWDKINKEGVVATNLVSISECAGISYNTLVNWFVRDKMEYVDNDEYIIFKKEVVQRGKQKFYNRYGLEDINKERRRRKKKKS